MKSLLFLDDERKPEQVTWVAIPHNYHTIIARNADTFRAYIYNNPMPDWVSFDHDLAPQHYEAMLTNGSYHGDTGYDCARWLVDYCHETDMPFPRYSVHSMNPVGAQNIKDYIENARKVGYIV